MRPGDVGSVDSSGAGSQAVEPNELYEKVKQAATELFQSRSWWASSAAIGALYLTSCATVLTACALVLITTVAHLILQNATENASNAQKPQLTEQELELINQEIKKAQAHAKGKVLPYVNLSNFNLQTLPDDFLQQCDLDSGCEINLIGNNFSEFPSCFFGELKNSKIYVELDRNPLGEAIKNLGSKRLANFDALSLRNTGLTSVDLSNFAAVSKLRISENPSLSELKAPESMKTNQDRRWALSTLVARNCNILNLPKSILQLEVVSFEDNPKLVEKCHCDLSDISKHIREHQSEAAQE